ncbi:MAG: EamA family transporter [Actinomycetia bacterium]|nr:EamA family transporter [Actinomycetes bacterium]
MTTTERAGAGAALAALAAAALWGSTGTAQALGPQASDPTSVGALRIIIGALVLIALAIGTSRRGRSGPIRFGESPGVGLLGRLPTPALMVIGGVAVAAYQAFFFAGVARSGVAVGTVVALGVAPLATGLLGLLLGEHLTRRWMLATAGAVTGVVLLVLGAGNAGTATDPIGIVAAVGAGVSYAGYTIAARALLVRGASGIRVMAIFFTLGALILAPALIGADLTWVATSSGLVMVLWLGLIATGLSYVLFQRGLASLPASSVATISLAEPVTATILGVLVLRERLSLLTAVGITVVVLSLLIVAVRRRPPPPTGRGSRARNTAPA